MWEVLLWVTLLVAAVLGVHLHDRKGQRKLWNQLEQMIDAARSGTFQITKIDETAHSSIEHSMQRFLEDSCLAQENVEQQEERIRTLISDISHQTVTPISNILLYSQLLEEELAGTQWQDRVSAIGEQTEKLSFLIDSLVKTSRLENGIIKTQPAVHSVAALVESVMMQMEPKAGEKGITVELEPPEGDVHALFDLRWTAEAVCNLVDNAVKYTQSGGRVWIRIISYPMFCRIDIQDDGAGMEEEELPKIFGRFYRCEQTRGEQGVGLGLYLAREIISSQGGYIKVSSQAGQGSTFSVFLPEVEGLKGKVTKL